MATKRTWWLTAGGMTAIAVALGVPLAVWRPSSVPAGPHVNAAEARAMLPAIDAYLASPADGNDGGMLHDLYPTLYPRVFCTAAIIEIRPAGDMLEAGMETGCGEYARRGRTLLEGTAGGAEEVMTLSRQGHRYKVLSAKSVGDAYDPGWINSHFSAAAAAEINDGTQPDPPDRMHRPAGPSASRQAPSQ